MANPVASQLSEDHSDYGSDFSPEEDLILDQIFASLAGAATVNEEVQVRDIEDFESRELRTTTREGENGKGISVRAARVLGKRRASVDATGDGDVQMGEGDSAAICTDSAQLATAQRSEAGQEESSVVDGRSPLERFRTAKHKGLTVTDLVSPAWCELEYALTLSSKLGRKRRTPMMKAGSAVHKKLEEQVHTVVKVDITTREDSWGLRVWNVIQGLRTLRETGQTRELEVWGTVDGVPVVGIIDELSNICPDVELEHEARESTSKAVVMDAGQATVDEFFEATNDTSVADNTSRSQQRSESSRIYICDVKTRASKRLPNQAAFRPTKMQLMLYHHLLHELVEDKVDFKVFEALWRVDADKPFTDSFLAQVGGLDECSSVVEADEIGSSQDSLSMLLAHNSLRQLWNLMLKEYQLTMPRGGESIGNILKAEYRERGNGEILGIKTFPMDSGVLRLYLDFELQWWQGKREPVGVVEEEAFKCQTCDFAETCDWRASKLQETIDRNRKTRAAPRRKAKVVAEDEDLSAEEEMRNVEMNIETGIKKWSV